jgi:hypothetical protein
MTSPSRSRDVWPWASTAHLRGEGPLSKLEHKWIGSIVADGSVIEERRLSGRKLIVLGLFVLAVLFPILYLALGPGMLTYLLPTMSGLTFILMGLPLARAKVFHVNYSEFIDKAGHQKWVASGLLDEAIQDTFDRTHTPLRRVPKWPYFLFYRLDEGLHVSVGSSKARQQYIVTVEIGGIITGNHLLAREVQQVLDGVDIVGG